MKNQLPNIFTLMAIIGIVLLSCQPQSKESDKEDREVSFLEEVSVSHIQQDLRSGKYTIKDVVTEYLDRIEKLDRNGPELNSIIQINPDALQIAEELDKEMAAGNIRGPLHGIPVILKDNIDTHDKMPTTAGSLALKNSYPLQDSWVAKKFRESGAIIIAKANLSEWANFRADFSSSGWSGLGGQTKNPYVIDRNPCGSSSGSGVAVSANLCALAIGTETNGSIVCPANANGVVGLKPTVGLISRSGIIPISFTQDTPGPMGRTVEDVAICLGELVGVDPSDSKTSASKGNYHSDYTQFLKEDGLKGKRIGVMEDLPGFQHRVDELLQETVEYMEGAGAEIIEVEFPGDGSWEHASFQVLLYEFKDGLNKYFTSLGDNAPVKSLEELIEFNRSDSIELRYFDQAILEMAQATTGLEASEYKEALIKMQQAAGPDGIDKLMDEYGLDAIMAPTDSPAWKTDLINGDNFSGASSSYAAISGYPNINVPMGFVDDVPVGVSLFGRAWSEPVLLEIAYGFEQGTKHRRPPKFLISD